MAKTDLVKSRKSGIGVTISYKPLHREMGKLLRQLDRVRQQRKAKGMPTLRVNAQIGVLRKFQRATRCQFNMLIGF